MTHFEISLPLVHRKCLRKTSPRSSSELWCHVTAPDLRPSFSPRERSMHRHVSSSRDHVASSSSAGSRRFASTLANEKRRRLRCRLCPSLSALGSGVAFLESTGGFGAEVAVPLIQPRGVWFAIYKLCLIH